MNILIVKLGALGDVLRTTSLLKPLRRRHPGSRVTWVTSLEARPLLAKNPYIRRLLSVQELGRLPEKSRFDLVLSLEEDAVASERAAEHCCGDFFGVYAEDGSLRYTDSSAPYYDMSLLNRDPGDGLRTANALKAKNRLTYARLWLKILGLPAPRHRSDLAPILVLDEQDRRDARQLAHRHGLKLGQAIGLNPGAGSRWPSKQLSIQKTLSLLHSLHRRFARPLILFGGRDEASRNREILRRTRAPVIDAGSHHGLRSFAGLLELCAALVTTDTLALHLAAALRVPAIALAGPTSAAELDAFGRGRIIAAAHCRCFYRKHCRFKTSCLDKLPDENILRAVSASLP